MSQSTYGNYAGNHGPYDLFTERYIAATGYSPRQQHNGWTYGRCPVPAHDDKNPSFAYRMGDRGVIVNCQAGCAEIDIIHAVGLSWAQLFAAPPPERRSDTDDDWMPCAIDGGPRHRAVASYPYRDESGIVLYTVVRCALKGDGCQGFRQWRPDPTSKSGKRWSLGDIPRVPYRLPEIKKAVARDQVIWITEGEKDVHALIERRGSGIEATCNVQGAGGAKWLPSFAPHFEGADVCIVADRDEAGKRHANLVAAALAPHARAIRIVQSRHGKDAADHFAGGGHTGNFTVTYDSNPSPATGEPHLGPWADTGPAAVALDLNGQTWRPIDGR